MQGRFTSPDPLLSSGKSLQPQSWNRYSYCLNDPLKYVDPKGLIWGTQDFEQDGHKYRRYHWFNGNKVGKGFTAFTPDKDGTVIALKGGGGARIYQNGGQETWPGPGGGGSSAGREHLNAAAGMVDGTLPFGKQIREGVFGKMGVDTSAPEYKNASTISGGVTTGALLLTGTGEAKLAEEGAVLYHGSDAASVENILANGINQAAAAESGGGDIFWATSNLEDAKWFAEANPAGGAPALLRIDISLPAVQQLITKGALETQGTTFKFSGSAWQQLNELGKFSRVP